MDRQDETLQGNEKIEVAIQALQKEATQEQLAHTLTYEGLRAGNRSG